jgi:hypothetical protein
MPSRYPPGSEAGYNLEFLVLSLHGTGMRAAVGKHGIETGWRT